MNYTLMNTINTIINETNKSNRIVRGRYISEDGYYVTEYTNGEFERVHFTQVIESLCNQVYELEGGFMESESDIFGL